MSRMLHAVHPALFALLGLGLLPALAGAQELPAVPRAAGPDLGTPPRVRVVGFEDKDSTSNCNPVVAQQGLCVEEVRFLDLDSAFEDVEPTLPQRAIYKNIAELYAHTWGDIAYRWGNEEDILALALGSYGVDVLPSTGAQWDSSNPDLGRAVALPSADLWLEAEHWFEGSESRRHPEVSPHFRQVRYHKPAGVTQPPESVILTGRFATRLAYDGKRHNYELMDGDKDSSGPFFEQMYPYEPTREFLTELNLLEQGRTSRAPLERFIVPASLKEASITPERAESQRREFYQEVMLDPEKGLSAVKEFASEEFRDFYHLVGMQIVRFAREEYTPTHIRVLAALVAMNSPPALLSETVATRDVVAASEGQTDDAELIARMANIAAFAGGGEFELNYNLLPKLLVEQYVDRFPLWHKPTERFLILFNSEIDQAIRDYLRDNHRPLTRLDDASINAWVEEVARPGREPDVLQHLKRIGLRLLVEELPQSMRDDVETRLLLDHVDMAISQRFDITPGYLATPDDVRGLSEAQWVGTLNIHNYFPAPVPDGPGAVDPTAICTTLDGRAALGEASFGVLNVDQLLVARDGLTSPEAVLWEAREVAPWLMIDDPLITKPEVARLVGLPGDASGDRAIYRVRWQVWSGWHFFWSTEAIGADPRERRVVLRTGAVCQDLVLAPPDLIPTLARAALLEGNFRPVSPVKGLNRKERKELDADARARRVAQRREEQVEQEEDAVQGAVEATDAPDQLEMATNTVEVVLEEDPERVLITAVGQVQQLSDLLGRKELDIGREVSVVSDPVEYVRAVARLPLYAEAKAGQPLAVVIFDARVAPGRQRVWWYRPRSPYVRTQRFAGGKWVRTASWTSVVEPMETPILTQVMPAYRPTQSVAAGSLFPKWQRLKHTDFTLAGNVGYMPVRDVTLECRDDAVLDSTVTPCDLLANGETESTEAITVDLSSLVTIYLLDRPRVAVEFGPALQIVSLVPRTSLSRDDPDHFGWAFAMSPRLGFEAGLRYAPPPWPLWRRGGGKVLWGAEKPDGTSRMARTEYGVRASGLVSFGYSGLELIGGVEGWAGYALRRELSPLSSITPYHPKFLIGPYISYQYTIPLVSDEAVAELDRYLTLVDRQELSVGVLWQLRMGGQAAIPEAP